MHMHIPLYFQDHGPLNWPIPSMDGVILLVDTLDTVQSAKATSLHMTPRFLPMTNSVYHCDAK